MVLDDKIPISSETAHGRARRSRLAADLAIDGDVTSDGPTDVYGKIVGSASSPEASVAASARIEGTVSAHNLSVLGVCFGICRGTPYTVVTERGRSC